MHAPVQSARNHAVQENIQPQKHRPSACNRTNHAHPCAKCKPRGSGRHTATKTSTKRMQRTSTSQTTGPSIRRRIDFFTWVVFALVHVCVCACQLCTSGCTQVLVHRACRCALFMQPSPPEPQSHVPGPWPIARSGPRGWCGGACRHRGCIWVGGHEAAKEMAGKIAQRKRLGCSASEVLPRCRCSGVTARCCYVEIGMQCALWQAWRCTLYKELVDFLGCWGEWC